MLGTGLKRRECNEEGFRRLVDWPAAGGLLDAEEVSQISDPRSSYFSEKSFSYALRKRVGPPSTNRTRRRE